MPVKIEDVHARAVPKGQGQTLIGGILAVIGFFVPWWFVSALHYFGVFGPVNLYLMLQAPARYGLLPDQIAFIRMEAIAPTLLLMGELVMCATGIALLRGATRSGLGRALLRLGTALSQLVAILGMLALVVACGVSSSFSLGYPYAVPLPFFGQLISLAGWVFVLRGLSAARKARRAMVEQPIARE